VAHTAGKPRCPGYLTSASRAIFSPHPLEPVARLGQEQGKAMREAVQKRVDAQGAVLGEYGEQIRTELARTGAASTLGTNIAGVLLGFTPTVQGNFLRVMQKWIEDGTSLWTHQQDLFEAWDKGPLSHEAASAALRKALFATMRAEPVPGMLWRTKKTDGDKTVVLGIASALADEGAPDVLMFGRGSGDATNKTRHGCPGYEMAMGVLLGMIAGLMQAGTLRPTGSPVLLMLTPGT
jgi:hypothetical protein